MDRGAWQAIVHEVTELDVTEQLNNCSTFRPVVEAGPKQCSDLCLWRGTSIKKEE